MKAICKIKPQVGLWQQSVDVPQISEFDVLIKIKKTAICGTDLHIYDWDDWASKTIPIPLITGHEFVGEIVETGRHVVGLQKGDRVSGEGHIVCAGGRHR